MLVPADRVLLKRGRDCLIGERRAVVRERDVVVDGPQDGSGLAELLDGEEIRRHEEEESRRVVRRTEGRDDEAAGLGGMAPAVVREGVELAVGVAAERIFAEAVPALLVTERRDDERDGLFPVAGLEDALVFRRRVVAVREAEDIAERINLPLALVKVGLHVRLVALPTNRPWGRR